MHGWCGWTGVSYPEDSPIWIGILIVGKIVLEHFVLIFPALCPISELADLVRRKTKINKINQTNKFTQERV